MTKITLNFRLLLFSETETKVYYVRKICLYFRNISGKVTSGEFCCSVNILFHSQTFLGIKLMISGVTAEEHHSYYSSYGAGKKITILAKEVFQSLWTGIGDHFTHLCMVPTGKVVPHAWAACREETYITTQVFNTH